MLRQSMDRITLLVVAIVSFSTLVPGWVIYNPGECPDNHRPGDKWQAGGCTEKVCDEHGYSTYGCFPVSMDQMSNNCYLDRDLSFDYPDCCTMRICKGMSRFNQTKLDQFLG